VSKCQHPLNIGDLLVEGTTLNVKREGIEPSLLTAFHPATKLLGLLATLDQAPDSYSGGLPGGLDKKLSPGRIGLGLTFNMSA
jgi:hypothetical protein